MHEIADEHMLEKILEGNEELAAHNREHLDEQGIFAVNFMSAPGAGKTTLLETIVPGISRKFKCKVIEGDMVGSLDADRLKNLSIDAIQISTGRSCHLDAKMIARVLHDNSLAPCDILLIENVGNLVCPAEFPLGEHLRVVLLSVTEGDDKPFKYPVIFQDCDAVVFTKADLLPHVNFDIEKSKSLISNLNARARIFTLSTRKSGSVDEFTDWLRIKVAEFKRKPLKTGKSA